MKTYLAAFALATAAASLLAPAALATTFPTLTTIYVSPGVYDNGGADDTEFATVASCSNVSGVSTTIRVLILDDDGNFENSHTFSNVAHGASVRASTQFTFLADETRVSASGLLNGVINVESLAVGRLLHFRDCAGVRRGRHRHAQRDPRQRASRHCRVS